MSDMSENVLEIAQAEQSAESNTLFAKFANWFIAQSEGKTVTKGGNGGKETSGGFTLEQRKKELENLQREVQPKASAPPETVLVAEQPAVVVSPEPLGPTPGVGVDEKQERPRRKLISETETPTFADKKEFYQDEMPGRNSANEVDLKDVKNGKALQEEIAQIEAILNSEEFKAIDELKPKPGEKENEYRKRILTEVTKRLRFLGDYRGKDDALFELLQEKLPRDEGDKMLMAAEAMYYLQLDKENQEMIRQYEKRVKDLGFSRMRTTVSRAGELFDLSGMEEIYDAQGKKKELPYRDMLASAILYERLMDLPYEKTPDGNILTFRQKLEKMQEQRKQSAVKIVDGVEQVNMSEWRKWTQTINEERQRFFSEAREALHKRALAGNPFPESQLFRREAYEIVKKLNDPNQTPKIIQELLTHYFDRHLPLSDTLSPQQKAYNEKRRQEITQQYLKGFLLINENDRTLEFFKYAHKGIDWMERKMEAILNPPKLHKIPEKILPKQFTEAGPYIDFQGRTVEQPVIIRKTPTGREGGGVSSALPGGERNEGNNGGPEGLPPAPGKNEPPVSTTPKPELRVEPPKELTFGMAAVKAGEEEVIEQAARLAAKQREQEERKQWKWTKKDLLILPAVARGLRRFWFNTIGQAAMYSKNKSQAVDMMANAGLQYRALPRDFQEDLDKAVMKELSQRPLRSRLWRRLVSDPFHTLTWTTLHGEEHRNDLLRRLRQAVIEIGEKDPAEKDLANYTEETKSILKNHPELLQKYIRVLAGDYQAREAMVKRLVDDVGGSLIDAAAGEKKAILKLEDPNDPLRKFLINNVLKPLLQEGLKTNGLSQETKLKIMVKLDEFMTSKEFVDWWSKAKVKDATGREVALSEMMEASLSFGNNLIAQVEEALLPQLRAAWQHQEGLEQLDNYLNNYLNNLSLNLALGTVQQAQKEVMPETKLERLVSKHVDRKKVLEEYLKLKDTAPSLVSSSSSVAAASVNRAELIRKLGTRRSVLAGGSSLVNLAVWAVPLTAGVKFGEYAAKAWIGGSLAPVVGPILGGAAAYGVLRGWQEMSLFGSNLTMHRIEKSLNHQFAADARLRREMDKLDVQRRGFVDYTENLNSLIEKINKDQLTLDEAKALIGYLADIEARRQIEIEKKITLFQASAPNTEVQEQEKTAMRKAAVQVREKLLTYLNSHQAVFNQIKADLGFNASATLDEIIGDKGELTANFRENILSGVDIDRLEKLGSQFKLTKEVSLKSLEAQATRSKLWKGVSIGALSTVTSAGGFFASRWFLEQAAELASSVPQVSGFLKTIGWLKEEIPQKNAVPVDINGEKIRLPPGLEFRQGQGIFDRKTGQLLFDTSDGRSLTSKITELRTKGIELNQGTDIEVIKKVTKTVTDKVPVLSGYDEVRTFDPQWVVNLQSGQEVVAGGYKFQAVGGILKIFDVSNNQPVETLNPIKITFKGGKALVSYDGVSQNTVPSNLLEALKQAGAEIKNINFWPPRISNSEWNNYLNSLGGERATVMMDENGVTGHMIGMPTKPPVPWPATPSGEHFPYTSKAFANFFENGRHGNAWHIFEDGRVGVENGAPVIHWDNGAISYPTPEMAAAYETVKNGGSKDGWVWLIQRPAPPGEAFEEGYKAAIVANGQLEMDVPPPFVGKVWASFGYLDKGGIFHKVAGFGPTENLRDVVLPGPAIIERIPKYIMKDIPRTVEEEVKERLPTYVLSWRQLTVPEWVGVPTLLVRRPLEAPEGVVSPSSRPQSTPQPSPMRVTGRQSANQAEAEKKLTQLKAPLSEKEKKELDELRKKIKKGKANDDQKRRYIDLESRNYEEFRKKYEREYEDQFKNDVAQLKEKKRQAESPDAPNRETLKKQYNEAAEKFKTKWGMTFEEYEEKEKVGGEEALTEKAVENRSLEEFTKQNKIGEKDKRDLEVAVKELRDQIAQAEAALSHPVEEDRVTELKKNYESLMNQYLIFIRSKEAKEIAMRLGITEKEVEELKKLPDQEVKQKIKDRVIKRIARQEVISNNYPQLMKIREQAYQEVLTPEEVEIIRKAQALKQINIMLSQKVAEKKPDFDKMSPEERLKAIQEFIQTDDGREALVQIVQNVLSDPEEYNEIVKNAEEIMKKVDTILKEKGKTIDGIAEKKFETVFADQIKEVEEQLRRAIEGVEESIGIPKSEENLTPLEGYIKRGINMIKDGKYKEALEYFKDRNAPAQFGFSYLPARVKFEPAIPNTNVEVESMANMMAMNSWFRDGVIIISDIEIRPEQNEPLALLTHDKYPEELLKEMALVALEEWLHAYQYQKGGPLAGIPDEEVDVAKYMIDQGIKLTNNYLLRYDRGKELGLGEDIDDSLSLRPAFRRGTFVRHMVSGKLQENWQIVGIDNKQGIVAIQDTNNISPQILISERDLLEYNQRGVYPFLDVKDINELKQKITELGNIYGYRQKFTAAELNSLIDEVVKGTKTLEDIPRSGGLRYKLTELLGKKETVGSQTRMM
jgi:hypothetical protein